MYCHNCGKEIDDTVKFCPYCGSERKKLPQQDNPPGNKGGEKNPWPRRVFIGLAVIAIVVVGLFAVRAVLDTKVDTQKHLEEPVATAPKDSKVKTTLPTEKPVPTESQILKDGWNTVDGKRYYIQDGEKYVDLQEIDGKIYYFDDDGVLAVNKDVSYSGSTLHAGRSGQLEGITFGVMYGGWAEEHYRLEDGGTSAILEFSGEVEDCDAFRFCLEAEGLHGSKVNGTWKIYIRHNGKWEFVQNIDYTQPEGYFDIKFDEPKTFDAITAHPTVRGNASYSSLFYLQNVHCII